MQVLGNRVLIEQTMSKKQSGIILPENQKGNAEHYNLTNKIISFGYKAKSEADKEEVPPKKGDLVVLSKYTQPSAVKVISKNDNTSVVHIIVNYDDIECIDNEQKS